MLLFVMHVWRVVLFSLLFVLFCVVVVDVVCFVVMCVQFNVFFLFGALPLGATFLGGCSFCLQVLRLSSGATFVVECYSSCWTLLLLSGATFVVGRLPTHWVEVT